MSASHSFSVEIASKYDVHQALLLQHFSFWYLKNKADGVNFFSSDYWVRMKLEKLGEYFPYLTQRQLSYTLSKLIENRLLKSEKFNQKRNDRTNWYTFTNSGKKLLKIDKKSLTNKIVGQAQNDGLQTLVNKGIENEKKSLTNKIVSQASKTQNSTDKIVSPTDKIVSSIYKEVDIEYRYILLLEILNKNKYLHEVVAMQNKVKISTVEKLLPDFCKHVISTEEFYNNNTELFKHFQNWFRIQKVSDLNCDEELNWFITKFNSISRGDFVVTDDIKTLFQVQLTNGFTGKQMAKAVLNLYSSDIKNKFHLDSGFKFATPSYLLKEGNLNKYLNVKY
ncbi:hypothetical protein [Tenacibaculum sp. nBUS_03]|uniref:hypothetical protein n=1 Tax=Tenacibaculum sp. nBUS_03 TaxID=3395320 RepID=UPI003EBEBDD1